MKLESQEQVLSVFPAMEQGIKQAGKELMTNAPTGKELAAVEAVITQQLIRLEQGLVTIHALIEKGDYLDAAAQAKTLKGKGIAVSWQIQAAIEKAREKKLRAHA